LIRKYSLVAWPRLVKTTSRDHRRFERAYFSNSNTSEANRRTMLPRLLRSQVLLRLRPISRLNVTSRRTLIAAPRAGDGPLMERRPDRELPGMCESYRNTKFSLICFAYRDSTAWNALVAHNPYIPRHSRLLHPRNLQLPKVQLFRRSIHTLRFTNFSKRSGAFGQ
jgi:hypothetical protein